MAPVLALSVSGSISQLSVIVAAAALLGVAVLTLLFFAQARELKRLREWGAQATDRLAELTRQQAALATRAAQRQVEGVQRPAQAGTLPPGGRPARATPLISRVPAATAATADGRQLAPAAGTLAPTAAGTAVPGLPVAGEQAPAIAAMATAASPALASVSAAPDTPPPAALVAPGTSNDAAIGLASQDDDAPAETAARSATPAAPAAAAPATVATALRPARAAWPPPPVPTPDEERALSAPAQRSAAPVRAASAKGFAEESRLAQAPPPATAATPARPGARSPLPPGPPAARRGGAEGEAEKRQPTIYRRERPGGRPVAIAAAALVVIVLAAVLIVSALGSSGRTASDTGTAGSVAGGHRLARAARGHATPTGSLRVVVLNATQVNGLAAHVASNLKSHGYGEAAPLFGTPSGAYPVTTVQYAAGHAADAAGVASVLKASSADVKPMQSAVAPLSGGAPVVVIVGEATANEGAGGATKGAEAAPAEGEAGAETAGETAGGGEATAGSQAAEPGA